MWLHQGCDSDLSADFLNFGTGDFPLKPFLSSASKSSFSHNFVWGSCF
jgi:hypothetical protein